MERGSSLLHRGNQQHHGALPPRGVKRDVLQLFASDRVWGKFGSSDRLWVGIVAHCKARGYLLFAGIVPRGNPE